MRNYNKKLILFIAIICLFANYRAVYSQNVTDNSQTKAQSSVADQVSGHVEKKDASNKDEPPTVNIMANPANILGVTNAENKIKDVKYLMRNNRYNEANAIIIPAVDWLNNATEFHTNLYKTLKDIDSAKVQADVERDLALRYAILRDQASFQMALLYIHENKLKEASDKLVDIVRSQPTTKLGYDAYDKLEEIGFTYKAQYVEQPSSDSSPNP